MLQAADEMFARGGMTEVLRHVTEIDRSITTGHEAIKRDERAAALGLAAPGGRAEADRHFTRVRRHAARSRVVLREQLETDTWQEASRRVEELRRNGELSRTLDDAQEVLLGILQGSDMTAGDAREVVDVWKQASGQLTDGGVGELFRWGDQRLAEVDDILTEAADWGRRPHSPLEWWQWLIIAAVLVIAIAVVVVCIIWFGCSWIYAIFVGLCVALLAGGGWIGPCIGIVF
jgi:hypothetical protein